VSAHTLESAHGTRGVPALIMSNFRRLPGLPPYGPMATPFPASWHTGHEGLVVEFASANGAEWSGNFREGHAGIDDVRKHPNGRNVLITSRGALWSVDPDTRVGELLANGVLNIWSLDGPNRLVFDDSGVLLFCLGSSGVLWRTQRFSWDGIESVRIDGETLTGEAWAPGGSWMPFSVNLDTGAVQGGSYSEPGATSDRVRGWLARVAQQSASVVRKIVQRP